MPDDRDRDTNSDALSFVHDDLLGQIERLSEKVAQRVHEDRTIKDYHVEQLAQAEKLKEFEARLDALERHLRVCGLYPQ